MQGGIYNSMKQCIVNELLPALIITDFFEIQHKISNYDKNRV